MLAATITEAGLAVGPEEVAREFEGMRLDDIAAAVEQRLGAELPPNWVPAFEQRRAAEFRQGVQAIPGVAAVLARLDRPASSSASPPRPAARSPG